MHVQTRHIAFWYIWYILRNQKVKVKINIENVYKVLIRVLHAPQSLSMNVAHILNYLLWRDITAHFKQKRFSRDSCFVESYLLFELH